uniref:CRIB domain-containing protein n=1 Tax=Leersia perrieri TaxID=77586 RepID=A0A0D9WYC3_9ORYZ
MSTKMKKGILRPFRYISNMMDGKEAQEMQIGFPTDVKHVAHIGWDGPSVPTNNAGAPSWMKDYHSAPLDSASFRSERGGSAASNPWASQEIVIDGGSLGDTSFRETRSEAGSIDITAGDSPPSPNTRRSRRHRSRGSAATSSMDCTGTEEKKDKAKKSSRGKNRKKDKSDKSAADGGGDGGAATTCQDLPAVPKKSNRRKNKGSSEASKADAAGAAAATDEAAAAAPLPSAAAEEAKDRD